MPNIWKELSKVSTQLSEEARKAGEAFLKKHKTFSQVANFAGLKENGEIIQCVGSSCHFNIGSLTYRDAVATENGWKRRKDAMKADVSLMEPFLKWFLSPSCIYSYGIVNKDDFEFCRDFGFIVTGNLPYKMLQNTMIMTRHFYEVRPQSFEKWNELTEKGFDPFLCYVVCFNSSMSDRYSSTLFSLKDFVYTKNGHRVSSLFTFKDFENYVKGETRVSLGKPYKEIASINGGSAIFKEPPSNVLSHYFLKTGGDGFDKLIKKYRGEDEPKQYSPPNPFKKSISNGNPNQKYLITYEELFEVFVPFIQEKVFDTKNKQ